MAVTRSRDDNHINPALIFEIYVNDNPEIGMLTNIDTSRNLGGIFWSDFPDEEEVLILPNFCFTTLDIVKDPIENITIIKVAEMPYQQTFELRKVALNNVLWIDPYIYSNEENKNYMNYFQS